MTTMTAANPITDSKFNALKQKLRELFELDKSDLDFGIYRIMAAKNKEVTEFLDRQLRDVVRETLASHGAGAAGRVRAELDEKIASLREDGLSDEQIDQYPAVQKLRSDLESAGGASAEELEADIYNHLLTFFSRYYDEGDFISKRRYKGDAYAIPYSGEEVTLHWANKDQYYIKSGEWHKDYRFKLPDGRRVRFALVDATQETGNNKEPDEAKRRYILVDDQPVVAEGDTLTFRLHFKAPSEAEKERAADGAVAIFGGDYAKDKSPKKGDERTQFCADAERRAIEHIPAEWKDAVTAAASTPDKPERTLLGKHLDAFTARNTFDYFIHKDLGGFLRRELDFYIKNEVVRLDDLDAAPAEHLQRVQGRVRAIRRVASKVIELLESLENFQKKLWLKKKFVLNTSWLVTVDRVPERLRDTVAENAEQWAEWERLGFKPEGDAGGLFGGAEWGTRAYLDACDKLVVDTRLFDEAFTAELLTDERVLCGASTLDTAQLGVLINSENFQALSLTAQSYSQAASCIYIDPPYNTKSQEFIYKDSYRHSSWASFMMDRLSMGLCLIDDEGYFFSSIDDNESSTLSTILEMLVGDEGMLPTITWEKRTKAQNTKDAKRMLQSKCEYIFAARPAPGRHAFNLESAGEHHYPDSDDQGAFRLQEVGQMASDGIRARNTMVFPIQGIYPRDGMQWKLGKQTVDELLEQSKIKIVNRTPFVIVRPEDEDQYRHSPFWSHFFDKDTYGTAEAGSSEVRDALGFGRVIETVKPTRLIEKLLFHSERPNGLVVDFFAGSGTTGHAVINRNRLGADSQRFILMEASDYFDSLVVPRIAKALYCSGWASGKPQAHDQGLSALVKCFAVESYEDALNNLPTPTGGMFDGRPAEEADALIRYALDLEMGPHLLDLDMFRDPWGHAINAQLAGDDEIKRHRVDLVETFNYLLGLRVSAYGPIERYSAEFERAEHDDGLGRLKLTGRLRRDPDGPFKFQRVEGVLNDGNDTRVLVVWRTLTDDPEEDAAVLDAWMARHREATTERTEHRDYHQIYINGPVTLPQPTAEIRTVYPIEEAFKRKMFEDTDGVS